jgi:hypothetical protein
MLQQAVDKVVVLFERDQPVKRGLPGAISHPRRKSARDVLAWIPIPTEA